MSETRHIPQANFAPALTVAYVIKGFLSVTFPMHRPSPRMAGIISHEGEMSIISQVADMADLVEWVWVRDFSASDAWPGIWDYDVSEQFGITVGWFTFEKGTLPTLDEAKELLAEIVKEAMQ